MLRALTAVSALNAHQLRPEIEPDGSLGIADAACFFCDLALREASLVVQPLFCRLLQQTDR